MPIINTVIAGGGTTPTGTKQITTNGTHDVTNYATADVQVPTTAPAYYIEKKTASSIHGTQLCSKGVATAIDLTGVRSLDVGVLAYAYRANNTITQAPDFSGIVWLNTDSMKGIFYQASALTGVVNLSSVTYGDNYSLQEAFASTAITGINLHSLQTINAVSPLMSMCQYCSQLLWFDLTSLETLTSSRGMGYTFSWCSNLITGRFPSLTYVSSDNVMSNCFENCSSLQSLWYYALTPTSFGSRKNQFSNMLSGVTGCTVHFPIAIQSTIGSWADVTAGFGGTNTTVLYDIVTTLTGADTNTYTRSEKDSTATATAWLYNNTLYYTSGVSNNTAGVNEPTVGDTIYSDSACTTAVTTISAIA